MAVSRSQFEWLFLHARLLPDLALSLLAQDILAAPRGELVADAPTGDVGDAPPATAGEAVDWFGTSGLSDEQLRELRESAERELAAFTAGAGQRPVAGAATPSADPDDEALDLERELAQAYAQRDAVRPEAQAAFGRIDRARLDALLARVPEGGATLTAAMDAADLAAWLALMEADDVALNELLDCVLQAGEGG